jgi:hypothetical protein
VAVGKGGLYDAETEALLIQLQARGIVLIVTDGARGSGFSVAMAPDLLKGMPDMLESVAKQIREDLKKWTKAN